MTPLVNPAFAVLKASVGRDSWLSVCLIEEGEEGPEGLLSFLTIEGFQNCSSVSIFSSKSMSSWRPSPDQTNSQVIPAPSISHGDCIPLSICNFNYEFP